MSSVAKKKNILRPLPGVVAIEPMKDAEKSRGGIVIPEIARQRRGGRFDGGTGQPSRGKVFAYTPPAELKGDPQLKVGDVVLYYPGNEIEHDDKTLHIVCEDDVQAVIEGE